MSVRLFGKKHIWIAALLCTQMSTSFATDYITPSNWFVSGDLGLLMPTLGNSSTTVNNGSTAPQPPTDTYSISKPGMAPTLALQGGYRWTRINPWFSSFSLGLRYQYLTSFNVSGTIQQYASVANTNYDYNLNVSAHVLSVFGKLDIYQFKHFAPYVTLGFGQAFSNVAGYSESAQDGVIPRVSAGYQNKNNLNMTYSVGLGVDYKFNRKLSMSLGYEYANFGKLKTGNGSAAWNNQFLSLGALSSSAVLLGLRYQIPD
jgi:outer membrane autotransporter protein